MVSIRNPWLWGAGLIVLLLMLALAGGAFFALRSQPQTATDEPRSQPIPTWTPTPAAGTTADPAADSAPPGLAAAIPTPTPDAAAPAQPVEPPAPAEAQDPAADVQAADSAAPAANGTTATGERQPVVNAAPAPTLASETPEGILAQALLLHRYGDYANARTLLTRVLDDGAAAPELRREAQYDLARAYLADGLYAEALAALDGLDAALAADGADPDQFGQKEQFLRGEALLGQGQYSDAIAAYWRFLDAYPWMGESV